MKLISTNPGSKLRFEKRFVKIKIKISTFIEYRFVTFFFHRQNPVIRCRNDMLPQESNEGHS